MIIDNNALIFLEFPNNENTYVSVVSTEEPRHIWGLWGVVRRATEAELMLLKLTGTDADIVKFRVMTFRDFLDSSGARYEE